MQGAACETPAAKRARRPAGAAASSERTAGNPTSAKRTPPARGRTGRRGAAARPGRAGAARSPRARAPRTVSRRWRATSGRSRTEGARGRRTLQELVHRPRQEPLEPGPALPSAGTSPGAFRSPPAKFVSPREASLASPLAHRPIVEQLVSIDRSSKPTTSTWGRDSVLPNREARAHGC